VPVGPGPGWGAGGNGADRPATVSPRREDGNGGPPPDAMPRIQPAEPIPAYLEPAGAVAVAGDAHDLHEEPSVPDEARARIMADATADAPVDAGPGTVLHVRFEGAAAPDRVVTAMEAFYALLRDRPGGTRVVIHIPDAGGRSTRPMEFTRGVAYDAELLAEVRRRLGDGLVDLRLASA